MKDSPDFDDWQVEQAEGLRRELSSVLEMLAQGYTAQGELEQPTPYARRWLALDRLNEAAHAHLMRLYAWSGRRTAALQQYDECSEPVRGATGGVAAEVAHRRL